MTHFLAGEELAGGGGGLLLRLYLSEHLTQARDRRPNCVLNVEL